MAQKINTDRQTEEHERVDIAALAAGVVAVAVAMFVESGTYDVLGATVGLSLMTIIMAYVVGRRRRIIQSLAVGMVFSLTMLPVIGFFYDRYYSKEPVATVSDYIDDVKTDCELLLDEPGCDPDSRMKASTHFWAWLLIAIATAFIDQVMIRLFGRGNA